MAKDKSKTSREGNVQNHAHKNKSWSTDGKSITVVSINQNLRDEAIKAFNELGYKTFQATSSLEGLKSLKEASVNCLVLDTQSEIGSSNDFLSLVENVSINKEIGVILIVSDYNDPALQDLKISLKNLCVFKADLTKEKLGEAVRQLLDPTYDPAEEKKRNLRGRVLVAESDEQRRNELVACLESTGLETMPTSKASDAVHTASERLPDVIMIGADIQGKDCVELVQELKQNPALSSIPCLIVCDEKSRNRVRTGAFRAGAFGCVMYPINQDEVLAQVGVMVKLTQTMAELQEHAVSMAVANFELNETRTLLEQKTKELERSGQYKSEFLAKMSHELRTPLTAMMGFGQRLLHMGPGDKDHNDAVRTIMRNGDHLMELINDILDLSKIEAGKLSMDLRPCSPVEILQDVRALMRIRAEQKGLDFWIEYQSDVPEHIINDSMRLKQILINLVGNAIKFTAKGSVKIGVSCDKAAKKISFQVVDTGIGISPEAKERLFQAFVQGDTEVTRHFGGTGLGLTISLQLAELLGGTVTVDSIHGMGSSFKVTVNTGPIDDVRFISSADAEGIKVKEEAKDEIHIAKLAGTILVAEDNADNRKLLDFYLKKSGVRFSFVENGKEVLEKSLDGKFDLILMDMQMPVMDGYTATKKLRERGFTRPIIGLTANSLESEIRKSIDAGCDKVLGKPYNWNMLFGLLKEYIAAKGEASDVVVKLALADEQSQRISNLSLDSFSSHDAQSNIDKNDDSSSSEGNNSPIVSPLYSDAPELQPLILEFLESVDSYIRSVENQLSQKEWAGLKQVAHDISGVSGMYGYAESSELAKQLRLACMQKDVSSCRKIANSLTSTLKRMKLGGSIMKSGQSLPMQTASSSDETNVITSDLFEMSPELAPEILDFINGIEGVVAKLKTATASQNWSEIKNISNEISGTASLFGYPVFAEAAKKLENAASEANSNEVPAILETLSSLKEAMLRGVKQIDA